MRPFGFSQLGPDIRVQDITANRHEVGIQRLWLIRLFDKLNDAAHLPFCLQRFFSLDYRVLRDRLSCVSPARLRPVSLKRATIAAVVAQRIRRSGIDDDIRQDHDERVVAHDRTSTQDGVTQAQRLRLTDVHDGHAGEDK